MALSKAFDSPIHILQAGTDLVKVGEEIKSGRGPMLISYVYSLLSSSSLVTYFLSFIDIIERCMVLEK